MENDKVKFILDLSGHKVSLNILKEEEAIFVTAREMLNDRLTVLKNKYSATANINQLLTVVAVEALVDALKVDERYTKLKSEVESRLDAINNSLSD